MIKRFRFVKICYQIDLEQYRDNLNIETQLRKGFVFIMDYNEDRQVYDYNNETLIHSGLFDRIDKTNVNSKSSIFLCNKLETHPKNVWTYSDIDFKYLVLFLP